MARFGARIFCALSGLAVVAVQANHDFDRRAEHLHHLDHHHARRLETEARAAEEFAVARNAERGVANYSMSEWRELYGSEDGFHEHLMKRGSFTGRASFYTPEANACGGGPEGLYDNVVAIAFPLYGNPNSVSKYCFKKIVIQYGSKIQTAEIVDACEKCPPVYGIDLSQGLFEKFASDDMGVFYCNWWFADGDEGSSGDGGNTPSTSSHPSTVSTSSHPSTASQVAATPSGNPKWDLLGGNLNAANQIVMGLGNLVGQVAVQAAAAARD